MTDATTIKLEANVKDPIGHYQCGDCKTAFKIMDTSIVEAYDGREPTCPTCGTQNDIQKVSSHKSV